MDATPATRKTVNSGCTGPAKSPVTATIAPEPAKTNSASATARVERLLAPVVTSSTGSIRRDCGFQGGADPCHLNSSHVTGAAFEHVGRRLHLLGFSPLEGLPQLIQP